MLRVLEGEPPTFSRKAIELAFYATLANSIFMELTGLGYFRFAGGGPMAITGLLALLMMLMRGDRLPITLWFVLAINIFATLSLGLVTGAVPIIGDGLAIMANWFFGLASMSYIVQNDSARKRVVFVMSLFAVLAVQVSGVDLGAHAGRERLSLAGSISGSLANSNTMSHLAGLLAVALLFWSLRASKLLRPILWVLAACLVLMVIRSVSRGGMVVLLSGLAVLLVAILLGRGVRLSGVVLTFLALLLGLFIVSLAGDSVTYLMKRFEQHSIRTEVYSESMLGDLASTLILGRGPRGGRVTGVGINAHNSFIYVHMVYGGVVAWLYVAMLCVLGVRLVRMLFAGDYPLDVRLSVVALLGTSFIGQMLSNMGLTFEGAILAFAVVDRFTAPYARRRIAERESAGYGSGRLPIRAMPASP